MSLNDARELGRGRIGELCELGRRGHDEADDLAAQFVQRWQRGERLDTIDIQDGFPHRAAEDDELLVRLGEIDGNLWRRNRIVRSSDHGRPLQQGTDGSDVSAFKSNFGETVLRDLHRRARLLHLHAQLLHLGDGEAGIVSNDRNRRGLEDLVELSDRLFFCRSFHSKLFPVGGLRSRGTAGLHRSSHPNLTPRDRSPRDTPGKTTFLKPALPPAFRPRAVEVRTKRLPAGLLKALRKANPVFTRLCRPYD
jgi:hypothetical protein